VLLKGLGTLKSIEWPRRVIEPAISQLVALIKYDFIIMMMLYKA
jgi:hypothetical protein